MSGGLRRSREPATESASNPTRPALGWMARGGAGAAAAVGVMLGSSFFIPAVSAELHKETVDAILAANYTKTMGAAGFMPQYGIAQNNLRFMFANDFYNFQLRLFIVFKDAISQI